MISMTESNIKHLIQTHWLNPSSFLDLHRRDCLFPLRQWIDNINVQDPNLAHRICRLIPSQCPFARKVKLLGRTILTIPPLCKLNPLYDELMMLRFRAISYLAEECGEDVSQYC